jgi:hypothetical protein
LPVSLVLKDMHLLTATYAGSPAEPVSVSQGSPGRGSRSNGAIMKGLSLLLLN